ncbi:MAG: thioredoxin family protein [Fibrobacterota bacterium]
MKRSGLKAVVLILFILAAGIVVLRKTSQQKPANGKEQPVQKGDSSTAPKQNNGATTSAQKASRARFIELGSENCVPCKMMVPVLDTLRTRYSDDISIQFIDVMKNRRAAQKYGIRSIPTQVILDESGREIFRHTGFWETAAIEEKLRDLSVLQENQ